MEPLFTISDLSSEFDISPRTIRFYEEKGMLSPRRTKGNHRVFDRKDRARLKLILRGKRFGYSLEEIAEMIGMTDAEVGEAAQIEKSLLYGEKKLEEIRGRIRELRLLEKDLLSVKERLLARLQEIQGRQD
jgi:DNA-binding transcriptional MerR regulator